MANDEPQDEPPAAPADATPPNPFNRAEPPANSRPLTVDMLAMMAAKQPSTAPVNVENNDESKTGVMPDPPGGPVQDERGKV